MSTYSGRKVNLLNPDPDSISIIDIAHHLSLICRYNGACLFHYSVAQHSVLGAEYLESKGYIVAAKKFILHDAHEAYTGDIIRPLKIVLPECFKVWADMLDETIFKVFGTPDINMPIVKQIDNSLLVTEKNALLLQPNMEVWKPEEGIEPLSVIIKQMQPIEAEQRFLQVYRRLYS